MNENKSYMVGDFKHGEWVKYDDIKHLIKPYNFVTMDMIKRAKTDDDWHFAQNINAMMKFGYCKKCGLVPSGCEREGCGAYEKR